MAKHVVVTGAAGFIGSAVVRQMVAQGRRVLAVLEPGADPTNLEGLDVERVTADVCDAAAMARVLSGAEAFHHLAAIYKLWLPDPAIIYRVNLEGTTTCLLAAQKAKVKRIVYTASIAAVGLRDDGTPADESTSFNLYDIANEYILTKHLSERIAMRFAEAGMPIVVVNPSFPFGERDRTPTPTGRILLDVLKGKAPGHTAGGVNVVDVEVVAEGHLLAEEKGQVGERYILGDHNVTWAELFATFARVAGVSVAAREIPTSVALAWAWVAEEASHRFTHKPPVATYRSMQYATSHVYFDVTKARRELGLRSVPLEETIARAIGWFRENGYLARN